MNFFETVTIVCVMGAIGIFQYPPIVFVVFPFYLVGRCCFGPVIHSPIPGGCFIFFLLIFIILPFWIIFGVGVGTVLIPISQVQVAEGLDDIKMAKWIPYQIEGGDIALDFFLGLNQAGVSAENQQILGDGLQAVGDALGDVFEDVGAQLEEAFNDPNNVPNFDNTQPPNAP